MGKFTSSAWARALSTPSRKLMPISYLVTAPVVKTDKHYGTDMYSVWRDPVSKPLWKVDPIFKYKNIKVSIKLKHYELRPKMNIFTFLSMK